MDEPRIANDGLPETVAFFSREDIARIIQISERSFDRMVTTGAFPRADFRPSARLIRWSRTRVLSGLAMLAEAATR